jgi:SAM-dependent methyltransferase
MDQKKIVREGYDALSRLYREDHADDGQYATWLQELLPYVREGAAVLDLGCGCGLPASRWLVEHGMSVTGVDISPVQIERARNLVPNASFLCADMTAVELGENTLDAIVSLFALIHVPVAEQPELLRQCGRWLVPGGPLLAIVGAEAWTGTEEHWLGGDSDMYWSHENRKTYLGWLGDAGFTVQWDRFVPEEAGGHTLLLATKEPDAAGRATKAAPAAAWNQRVSLRRTLCNAGKRLLPSHLSAS